MKALGLVGWGAYRFALVHPFVLFTYYVSTCIPGYFDAPKFKVIVTLLGQKYVKMAKCV